jgi:hypothetical protein
MYATQPRQKSAERQDPTLKVAGINHSSWASGPEIIALITPFPSSLFPERVALKATKASSNLNLCHTMSVGSEA